jgi:hypothetical protein
VGDAGTAVGVQLRRGEEGHELLGEPGHSWIRGSRCG